MGKIKVYEMARKVGMNNKDFMMKLQEWGIEVKSHLNVLEDDEVKKIQEKLNEVKPKNGSDNKQMAKEQNKKNEKKKDEPRIIRREIIQVREDFVEEKPETHSSFDYDLKPKKTAKKPKETTQAKPKAKRGRPRKATQDK